METRAPPWGRVISRLLDWKTCTYPSSVILVKRSSLQQCGTSGKSREGKELCHKMRKTDLKCEVQTWSLVVAWMIHPDATALIYFDNNTWGQGGGQPSHRKTDNLGNKLFTASASSPLWHDSRSSLKFTLRHERCVVDFPHEVVVGWCPLQCLPVGRAKRRNFMIMVPNKYGNI